jgi:hypothetical protein
LPAGEKSELDRFLELEHIMRLAKARARHGCPVSSLINDAEGF